MVAGRGVAYVRVVDAHLIGDGVVVYSGARDDGCRFVVVSVSALFRCDGSH